MNASRTNWLFLAMVLLGLVVAAELYFGAGSGTPSVPATAGMSPTRSCLRRASRFRSSPASRTP